MDRMEFLAYREAGGSSKRTKNKLDAHAAVDVVVEQYNPCLSKFELQVEKRMLGALRSDEETMQTLIDKVGTRIWWRPTFSK